MNWFNNLLQTSWLSTAELFGLGGWFWLAVGFGVVVVLLVILAIVSSALRIFLLCLLAVPIYALLVVAWPDLWFWPTIGFVVAAIGIALAWFGKLFARLITIVGVILMLIVTGLGLFGVPPLVGGPSAICAGQESTTSVPHYFNLEPNKPLNTFGPAVAERDEAGIKSELHNRRCVDPALTASHYAAEGFISLSLIDQYTARFNASRGLWLDAITQMEQSEKESVVSLEQVPAGTSTLYMETDGNGGVLVRQGVTIDAGTAVVFTHPDGRVVKLRLECGFQPVFDTPPPGIPECEGDSNCIPPVCPYNPSLPPDSPDCLQPKDPADDVESPDGWTQLPAGPLTTGNESEDQQQSGEVSGNLTDDTLSSDTSPGSTTSDLPQGTTTGTGATDGGDNGADDTVDTTATNQNPGGTGGDAEILTPAD